MEAEMHAASELVLSQIADRSPSPEQQQVLTSGRNAVRHLAIDVVAALVRWWRAQADRRQRRRAMAQLGALSDLALKDIGVRRSEIYWVVTHGRHDPPARALGRLDSASVTARRRGC
jgi:uncharacterized protein YjiS (DUF1127 family)